MKTYKDYKYETSRFREVPTGSPNGDLNNRDSFYNAFNYKQSQDDTGPDTVNTNTAMFIDGVAREWVPEKGWRKPMGGCHKGGTAVQNEEIPS